VKEDGRLSNLDEMFEEGLAVLHERRIRKRIERAAKSDLMTGECLSEQLVK
jgi:hypothetical protein